jgi:hypothetical protein
MVVRAIRSSSRRSWLISTTVGWAHPGQLALQPLDTGKIKMIGRFVEQQDIGRGGQRTGQGGTARLTAGQSRPVFRTGQA